MNDSNPMQEKSWRRKLSAADEAAVRAWLAEHPEAKADWELERHLTEALGRLPDVPVPSNFTARVLQAVEVDSKTVARPTTTRWRWFLRSLMPKTAVVAAIVAVGVLSYHEHMEARRAQLVQSVKVVAGVPSLPSPEILQDFDTIRQMGTTPGPDPELIALMK